MSKFSLAWRIHRCLRFPAICIMLFVLFAVTVPEPAAAHPLGNFSVNRYSRLELSAAQIQVFYVLDMAEIPTFQEWVHIDSDGDETVSDPEHVQYLEAQVTALTSNLHLTLNGRSQDLTVEEATLTFPPGQGDLPTLRLEVIYDAPVPEGTEWSLTYGDDNYANRLGWQEVVVQADESVSLLTSTAPTEDVSQALRQYPQDLLQSPLRVHTAELRFAAAAMHDTQTTEAAGVLERETAVGGEARFGNDRFAELITITDPGPGLLMAVLLLAFGLGALHALSPGHGKTIVAAYLVGSRGTAKHALFLGLTTTITHTAGVFLFGLIVLFASQFILPEQLYPWLGVMSGLLVVMIGFSLFQGRWRTWRQKPLPDHSQVEGYHTHFGIGHTHTPPTGEVRWRNLLALGVSGGLLPCPSALVLLLSAIALQRVAFGLVLIVVFSVGLASVLTGIGVALVYASRLFERMPVRSGRLAQLLPLLSALFITLAGIGITAQALIQTGIL